MKEIILTRGKVTEVDDELFDFLSQWNWFCSGGKYAARGSRKEGKLIYMHRVIVNAQDTEIVDHIDRNSLNNQRYNLRKGNTSTNMRNAWWPNQTGYKGVHPSLNKFCAYIWYNGKKHHLGTFDTAEEAAMYYNISAIKVFGDDAVLNSIVRKEVT